MVSSTIVASKDAEIAVGLAALADPVRLAIVGALADGERCVCQLLDRVPVAANLLSYHLRVLRDAGLVQASRRGRWVDYSLHTDGFATLWAGVAAVGVPLPGHAVTAARVPGGDGPMAEGRAGAYSQMGAR